MNTLDFIKQIIEEIKPNFVLGDRNTPLDFIDLPIKDFVKLRSAIDEKYGVLIEIQDMYKCVGVVELSRALDSKIFIKENTK